MNFWLLVVILITLIVLCWSGTWYFRSSPDGRGYVPATLLGVLGLILFIVLVVIFINDAGVARIH